MIEKGLIAVAMVLMCTGFGRAASSPENATTEFYAVYSSFHPSDGVPAPDALAKYAPVISSALSLLIVRAEQAEGTFAASNKDSPPLVEGDLFTSNFEGATTYRLSACTPAERLARCRVDLVYDGPEPADKPVRWTDTVVLAASDTGWRVDDIEYGGMGAFENRGRVTDLLRKVISDAGI